MMQLLAVLSISFILFSHSVAFSETKEIVCEGTYIMGDSETPVTAEIRALLSAKRTAMEQAGTYIESYSKVQNLELAEDEVKVIASGLIDVTVLDRKRSIVEEGFHFWVRIKAVAKPDRIKDLAKKAKDKSVIEDYKELHEAYDKSRKEIEELKKQLASSGTKIERHRVGTQIAHKEKQFKANVSFEEGLKHSLNDDHDKAIEAYTNTIELDPENEDAHHNRGTAYHKKGHYEKAGSDLKKACKMGEKYACEDLKKI